MKLQALSMLFAALVFSGCWPCPEPEPIYVDRKVEVVVTEPCIVPEVHCATVSDMVDMNDSAIAKEGWRCTQEYKEKVKVCQPNNK